MPVLDSTAPAVPLPGQDRQTAATCALGAVVRPALLDPTTMLVREDPFLRVESTRAQTHGDAGARLPSTHALRCIKAASSVTADPILEEINARI